MRQNVSQKLVASHLVSGRMKAGEEIALKIDQTLTQDATGTLALLEFEAMGLPRVRTEVSVQYVDHNLLQAPACRSRRRSNRFMLSASAPGSRFRFFII